MNTVRAHPAETGGGVAAAVAVLIAHVFGITDTATFAALVIVVGFIPAAITWTVELARRRNGSTPPA